MNTPNWTVGQSVDLGDGTDWTVAAVTAHFAALTATVTEADVARWREWHEDLQVDGGDAQVGDPKYTVIDWRNQVRGPCNLSGHGWGDGTYTAEQCKQMLAKFEAGGLEISHRNRLPVGGGERVRSYIPA